MPVVMRKTNPDSGSDSPVAGSEDQRPRGTPREVSPAVFIGVIALVVLIVAFIAYRMFAPGETWDNAKQGQNPNLSSLSAPPPLNPRLSGAGQGGGAEAPSGAFQRPAPRGR